MAQRIQSMLGGSSSSLLQEQVICFRELAALYHAGIPFHKAFHIISEQTSHLRLKTVYKACYRHIQAGQTLSAALSAHPDVFPELYLKMIEVGEKSGRLEQVFNFIAEHVEKKQNLMMKLKTALTYPAFVFILCIVLLILAPSLVFDKLFDFFHQLNVPLPLATRILIAVSAVICNPLFPVLLLLIIATSIITIRYLWKHRKSRRFIQCVLLSIPGIGAALHCMEVTMFTRNMAILYGAAVPLYQILYIVQKSAGIIILQEKLDLVRKRVMAGSTLQEALAETEFFPPAIVKLIMVGEEAGDLEKMFEWIIRMCEEEFDARLESAISLLQPITLLIIGGVVGFIIFAMMMPMIKIVETL